MITATPCNPAEVKVTLLKGGKSGEREVSLRSGAACAEGLESMGFTVTQVDTADDDMIQQIIDSKPDVVYCALHGRDGEDGRMQGLLELLRLPYTGSGVLASALAMDKTRAKQIYRSAGLPTAQSVTLVRGEAYDIDDIVAQVGEHCVVKPASEGSSIGMSMVTKREDLQGAIDEAFKHDHLLLVETFVAGVETTVAVLGNEDPEALPVIEIVPQESSAFYDFEAKYAPGGCTHIIPARIPAEQFKEAQRIAVEAHKALGCSGVSRTDIICNPSGEMWILETNTLPGMTATSLLPDAAKEVGIEFGPLCKLMVELALEKKN